MKATLLKILIAFIILQFIYACEEVEKFPPEPYIEFISFDFDYNQDALGNMALIGTLKFYFRDGDGDIGQPPGDTANQTIFIDRYNIINSEPVLHELAVPMNYNIPYFSTTGNKTLEGEIIVNDINLYGINNLINDTIKYKFYIVDRAGNVSNTESTGILPIKDFVPSE